MNRPGQTVATRVVRAWWFAVGCLAVGVGGIGVVVPGLPTTVFFIAAAWCFGRSSPRFERWVLDLPRVGPLVADYRAGLGMPARTKVVAITTMWVAIGLSAFALRGRVWVVALVVVAGLVGTAYLSWRIPTRVAVRAATTSGPEPMPAQPAASAAAPRVLGVPGRGHRAR